MDVIMQIGFVILAALLPVVLAILARASRKLRPERELTLRLRSQARLPELDLEPKADLLEIRWAGQPVSTLFVSRWSLTNSGAQPIRRDDFDDDLRIQFPKCNFLGASVFAGDPPELASRVRDALSTLDTGFTLKPLLWNPKESVDLTVITKDPISSVDQLALDARIVSGKVRLVDDAATEKARARRQERRLLFAMTYASLLAAIAATIIFMMLR